MKYTNMPDGPEMELLRLYVQQDLETMNEELEREDEVYGQVRRSVEKHLARVEELDGRLAEALREDLAQLRQLERRNGYWLGFERSRR